MHVEPLLKDTSSSSVSGVTEHAVTCESQDPMPDSQRSLHIFRRRAAFARRPSEPHCEAWSPNEQPFAFLGPGRWRKSEIQDGYVARFSPELDLLARACTEFPGRLRAAKLIMQPSAPAMSEVWGTTTVTFILI